ncbi:hypothetical protein ACFXI0_10085 [Kitasatospora indigofera]|uniref:hypothetical protein n=1 Tax=Kitasatospora indigofera TaxID=67307 RepID=UPI0036786521
MLTDTLLPPANVAGLRWLANLHPDPRGVLDTWHAGKLAPIPLGDFHVVRTTSTLGILALQQLEQQAPGSRPVLWTRPYAAMDFLVAPTPLTWQSDGAGRLLKDGFLECPPPGRASEMRWPSRWAAQPDGTGHLPDMHEIVEALLRLYHQEANRPEPEPPEVRPPAAGAAAAFFSTARRAAADVH